MLAAARTRRVEDAATPALLRRAAAKMRAAYNLRVRVAAELEATMKAKEEAK